jgi:hypothetical protein
MMNRLTVMGVVAVAGFVACGGSSSSGDEAASSGDAGNAGDAALCQNLANQASAQFDPMLARYQTCAADSDCVEIHVDTCVGGPCPQVRTNTAGAAALPAAATMECREFHGAGCQTLAAQCAAEDTVSICDAGACAGWHAAMEGTATTFVHGVCEPFEIDFTMKGSKTPAPHDIVFTMGTPSNGTLYADAACTTPLTGTTITIPAGASSVAFGFEPLEPGMFSFGGTTTPGSYDGESISTGNIAQ